MRNRLPNRRESRTLDVWHNYERYHVSYSRDANNRIAEIFMHGPKVGSQLDSIAYDLGVGLSVALQHGACVDELLASASRLEDGKPASVVGAVLEALAPLDNLDPFKESLLFPINPPAEEFDIDV